jgi:FAD synthase
VLIREDADWVDAALGVNMVRVDTIVVGFDVNFGVDAEVDFVETDFDEEAGAEVETDFEVETGVDDITSGVSSLLLSLFFLDFFVFRGFV